MSTPRQERGILADILARCSNCNIKDHKTQMFPSGDEPETWLCHVCGEPPPEGYDPNGDVEPTTPARSRRSTRN